MKAIRNLFFNVTYEKKTNIPTMHIDIITLFPDLFSSIFSHSILQRSQDKGIVTVEFHNLRDYALNKYRSVDDYSYGGAAGMVMQIEPIANCLADLKKKRDYDEIIYTAPDGEMLNQSLTNELSLKNNICILCGHYKGVDERVREHLITREISIGNYVLSGGELAAAVISDAIIRVIPGVLNDETSALTDSFQDNLVSPPVYSRPSDYNGWKVPEILLSGNTKLIDQWNLEQSIKRTKERRPELL
jgi:tRNA (guanine37-N1)-methyltransferase